jgi:hypothetical protein
MVIILVLLESLLVGIGLTLGSGFAIRYYRGRFQSKERKAAIIIGVAFAVLLPTMFCSESLLPGRLGELTATSLIIAICVACAAIVWRILAA